MASKNQPVTPGSGTIRTFGNSNIAAEEGSMTATIAAEENSTLATGNNTIRPFQKVTVPETELTELRRRINNTKWPERETVTDATQGVQLATTQALARYWGTEYDWRRCEARLNALPQFITEIDGLDIHFIHVRSKHENALPLIVTHGWPGSVVEQLKIIDPLTNPTAHGGSASDAFDVVIPSLPGTDTQATDHDRMGPRSHRTRLGHVDEAPRLHEICCAGRRLGRNRCRSDGRASAAGVAWHPYQHAWHLSSRD
jgi:Epoxide hydrolase N terminus